MNLINLFYANLITHICADVFVNVLLVETVQTLAGSKIAWNETTSFAFRDVITLAITWPTSAELIKKAFHEQNMSQPISCVIFCTDCYSDIDIYDHLLPKELPYVWIVPRSHNEAVELKGKKVVINDK